MFERAFDRERSIDAFGMGGGSDGFGDARVSAGRRVSAGAPRERAARGNARGGAWGEAAMDRD